MYPIGEFEFDTLDDSLQSEFVNAHNRIVKNLEELRLIVNDVNSTHQLDIFLTTFTILKDDKSEYLKSLFCATKPMIEILFSKYKGNNTTEKINQENLKNWDPWRKNLLRKSELESLNKPSADEKNELKELSLELSKDVSFKAVIQTLINYDDNRDFLVKYYHSKHFGVCLYCLAQYTSIYESDINKGKLYLKGNLDHIYPQRDYPFLAVCINNLIPVCSHCNQRKGSYSFNYNPFDVAHKHSFNFSKCIHVVNGTVTLSSLKDLEIDFDRSLGIKIVDKLDLSSLYKMFEENARLMVERYRKYESEGYKKGISNVLHSKKDLSKLEYFVSEIPLRNDNISKHPLTKFKIDLYQELIKKSSKK